MQRMEREIQTLTTVQPGPRSGIRGPPSHSAVSSLVSHHIVLMRTNFINLLNCVPEHDSLTFFVLVGLQYISFCVARKKLLNRALGPDS